MPSRAGAGTKLLGVVTHLAPGVEPLYAFLTRYLADRLGRRPEFVVADSYERCAQGRRRLLRVQHPLFRRRSYGACLIRRIGAHGESGMR